MQSIAKPGLGLLGALWGAAGLTLLLGFAIVRLTPIALEALRSDLAWHQWLVLTAATGFMAYYEGYRGFQKAFSPRFAARCRYLQTHPTALRVLLAPLFCLGWFGTTRRRQMVTLILTLGIIAAILLVQHTSQPWRGIIDASVVVGLTWGLISSLLLTYVALTAPTFNHSPEVPNT
ncbi:MAG: hypothetical protein ACFCUG_06825 [Thiotrichales bacterium]